MRNLVRRLLCCLAIVAGLIAAPGAYANVCTVSATPLAFGSYASPGGSAVTSNATLTVTCTPDLILGDCTEHYSVALNQGVNGTFAARKMKLTTGTSYLDYNLYTSNGYTTVWGTGASSTATVPGVVSSSILILVCLIGSTNHTVYGRIPGNQNIPAGFYSDTITVTVTW